MISAQTYNGYAERIHAGNQKWWHSLDTGEPIERNVGELLMLVVSEFAEALEGHRKDLMDDKLPHRKMFEVELADAMIRLFDIAGGMKIKFKSNDEWTYLLDTETENTAENLLRLSIVAMKAYVVRSDGSDIWFGRYIEATMRGIERLAKKEHLDLWGAVEEKVRYNATRHDHTVEGRKAQGGKKY